MEKIKRPLPRRVLKNIIILLLLGSAGGGAYWYYLKQQTITVRTQKIERGLFLHTVTSTSSGTIKADRLAKIASRINGRVIGVNFDEGDRVEEGKELVVLDPEEALAKTKVAEADLALARVRYERAKASYELEKKLLHSKIQETAANLKEAASALRRARDMMKQNIYSDQQLDSAIRNYDVAKAAHDSSLANQEGVVLKEKEMLAAGAEIKQLEETLEISRIQEKYLSILAPFGGIISTKSVEVGEMVLPGVSLFEILDDRSIYIQAPIDEADIHKIKLEQKVKIAIDAYPGAPFSGRVYEISPIVSEEKQEGRTVTIKIAIDPHNQILRPGMSCDIEIQVEQVPGALLVPTNLLMGRGDKKYVFAVEGGRIQKRSVILGLSNWDFTVVEGGLKEGDEIISSIDILNLDEGSRVKVEKDKT